MSDQLDSAAYYHIAYEAHAIMNPLSDERFLLLAAQCGLNESSQVLDVGSGNGWSSYLLCRSYGCHSTQVDISEQWTTRARELFEEEGLAERTEIHCMDANAFYYRDASYDLVLCLGTALMFGGFERALRRLSRALRPDGYLIIGEPSTESTLPKRYREFLDASGWEVHTGRQLLRSIDDCGLEMLWTLRSTHDEWDRYMSLQWKAISDRARANPGDGQLQDFLGWVRDEQETYLRYQRHHVDWNIFLFRPL